MITHGDLRVDAGPPRGARRRRGDPARAEGVRPALGAARPPRARADARPAARARLGLHVRRRHAHGRRARPPAAPQARRRVADRHRLGRRLQGLAREGRTQGHRRQPRARACRCSRRSASGCRSLFLGGHRARGPRHDADRGPALPGLRARPDAHRAAARGARHRGALLERGQRELRATTSDSRRAADVRARRPRARDRRPDLLRSGRQPVPGREAGPARLPTRRRSTGRRASR